MIKRVKILLLIFICSLSINLFAQVSELDSLLQTELDNNTTYTIATFKSTRIINGHSVERMQKKDLDFRISHRFGNINSGAYEFFGLDHSSSNLNLEYGLFNWIMIGVGRATYQKTFTGFTKISFLRQSKGKIKMPVSVSYLCSNYLNSMRWVDETRTNYFSSRLSYLHQLLIARKISSKLSVQLSPTFLHRNLVELEEHNNDIKLLGIGGRFKITTRTSINIEYFYLFDKENISSLGNTNPLSIGFDIETGSHVFQLHLTNYQTITENAFLGETTDSWKKGDIYFGFNITRVFSLGKKNEEYEEME